MFLDFLFEFLGFVLFCLFFMGVECQVCDREEMVLGCAGIDGRVDTKRIYGTTAVEERARPERDVKVLPCLSLRGQKAFCRTRNFT